MHGPITSKNLFLVSHQKNNQKREGGVGVFLYRK